MLILNDHEPRGLGYVHVDQRAVDAELPPGVQRNFEADTYTCTHCSTVVVLNPLRKRERYKCKGCNHHICDPCAADMTAPDAQCITMARRVEEYLERVTRQPEPQSIILP